MTRHVRTPAGAATFHEPIGAAIVNHPNLPGTHKGAATPHKFNLKEVVTKATTPTPPAPSGTWPANVRTVPLNGKDVRLFDAVKIVGDAYDWKSMDKEGGLQNPYAKQSMYEQHKAQIIGKAWQSSTGADEPMADQMSASVWHDYQNPDSYVLINEALRTGKENPDFTIPVAQLREAVHNMFVKGGYTLETPMTTYRALKSKRESSFEPGTDITTHDWAKELTPGTVFTDHGIVSTTAHQKFSLGWLSGDLQGNDVRQPQSNDVLMEIRLPKGMRVVGGDPGFIETMLPPDTSLRVVSSEVVTGAAAVNPLDHSKSKVTYTHVVAEVVHK